MRVSDLQFTAEMANDSWKGHRVETLTDSYRIVNNRESRNLYTDEFDDVEIEYDVELKAYRVPAFADRRANYSEAKQVDCDRWGSE
tara:strand:- start:350 stop:607 length:258 start_codon:yes stop_codon:yes gene_type:complete